MSHKLLLTFAVTYLAGLLHLGFSPAHAGTIHFEKTSPCMAQYLKTVFEDRKYPGKNRLIQLVERNSEFGTVMDPLLDPPGTHWGEVRNYTQSGYWINDELVFRKTRILSVDALRKEQLINRELSFAKKFKGKVYSGAYVDTATFNKWNLTNGGLFAPDFFLSSSIKPEVAKTFTQPNKNVRGKVRVFFEISSATGVPLSGFSAYTQEAEVLFRSTARFRITKVSKIKVGRKSTALHVQMSEIPRATLKPFIRDHFKKRGFIQKIDERRMFNEEEWTQALIINKEDPGALFGESFRTNWMAAEEYTRQLPLDEPITEKILMEIHSRATKDLFFKGYEARRIEVALQEGAITPSQAKKLTSQINNGSQVTNTSHSKLRKTLRTDAVDAYVDNGLNFDKENQRFFTYEEINHLLSRPFFRLQEHTVEGRKGRVYAEVHYVYPENVERTLAEIIRQIPPLLKAAQSDVDYIRSVNEITKALMMLHPFLDGNGRTIRLFGDYLFRRRGLPPPLHAPKNDFYMNSDELLDFTIEQMNKNMEP